MTVRTTLIASENVKKACRAVAKDMLTHYTGMNPGDVPGNLPDPYYWWEGRSTQPATKRTEEEKPAYQSI